MAASLFITTITVKYIAVILVIVILTIYKKSLGLSRVRILPLPGYDQGL